MNIAGEATGMIVDQILGPQHHDERHLNGKKIVEIGYPSSWLANF